MRRSGLFLGLTLWAAIAASAQSPRVAYWVFLREPVAPRHLAVLVEQGATVRTVSRWFRAVSVEVDPAERDRLRALPFVAAISPVAVFRREWTEDTVPSAPAFAFGEGDFQREQIRADVLHRRGLFGEGVRIGLLDTGFETTHRVFEQVRIVATRDFVHDDDIVADEPGQDDPGEAGHGTQILSILAANAPDVFVGVAPLAEYVLAKTEDVSRNGRMFEAKIEEDYWIAGLEWLVEMGCRVVNSSLGYALAYQFSDLDGKTALVTLAAEEAARRGTLVVNSAGNGDGRRPFGMSLRNRINPPADARSVLTVGAATETGNVWPFSAQGPTFDGRIKPDVLALGRNVVAVSTQDDVSLMRIRGTSASAPLVAGVAALLLEVFPQATPGDLLVAIRETASRADAPDNRFGYGLVDAAAAYDHLAERFGPAFVRSSSTRPSRFGEIKRRALTATLDPPYPNPARRPFAVPVRLREAEPVRLTVYDLSGREIETLAEAILPRGLHMFRWNGRGSDGRPVARGIYILTLTTREGTQVRRLLWRGE